MEPVHTEDPSAAAAPRRDADTAAPAGAGARLAAAWNRLADGLGALGTVMIGLLMLVICADVAARNLMGASLPLVSELGALMLVMIVYLQLATTIRHRRLARTDLFFAGFKTAWPRAGAALEAVFDLTAAAAIGTIAWATIRVIEKDFTRGEYIGVTGIATLPAWPFRVLIFLGIAVASVQCLLLAASGLRAALRPKEAGK